MLRLSVRAFALVPFLLVALAPNGAAAFCGFYVGGADSKLYNDATQVVLLRKDKTTILSMQNNYEGPAENFALVIPVPEVLQKANVKTLDKSLFDRIDRLSAPRLVEYWEQDPCAGGVDNLLEFGSLGRGGGGKGGAGYGAGGASLGVTVEAEFKVAEYDIVILSAKEATGLETWLKLNRYEIPDGAAPFFKPYIESGSYFFVAKVDVKKAKYENGSAVLSPLRFHYTDESFRLPVRLGLINAKGKQDLLVYILGDGQRYQVANYPNVKIPTNLEVSPATKDSFAEFYEALASRTFEENPGAVITEYAWPSGSCDPCPAGADSALTTTDIATLGGDVTGNDVGDKPIPVVTPGRATVGGNLNTDVVRRIVRRHLSELKVCQVKALKESPGLQARVDLRFSVTAKGSVRGVSVKSPGNRTLDRCITERVKSWKFPKPTGGGLVNVEYPLNFSMRSGRVLRGNNNIVLTRLHARYDAQSLGEDLVFEKAEPIVGGRESDVRLDRQLSGISGLGLARVSGVNQFQGRYIIRHEWSGPVECENPRRGIWGGPPSGETKQTLSAPSPNTTGLKPRQADLSKLLTTKLPTPTPAVRNSPADNAASATNSAAVPPPKKPAIQVETKPAADATGCGVARSAPEPAALVVLFGLFGMTRRTQRRRMTRPSPDLKNK